MCRPSPAARPIPGDLSAGEGEMGDTAGRADRLNVEALLESLEPVPQAFPACENDGHDRDVHLVDQVGREELADCRWSSANSDVQTARRLPGGLQGLGGACARRE